MKDNFAMTIKVDNDFELLDKIKSTINVLNYGDKIINIITSPCFTEALLVVELESNIEAEE